MAKFSLFCNNITQIVRYICLFVFKSGNDITFRNALQASSFQFMQTIFDSCALGLVIWKTFRESLRVKSFHSIKSVILKHGVLYYL